MSYTPFGTGGAASSGTSFTPVASELSFGVPVAGNVLMGLPWIVTAGTGLNVTYDKFGRVTSTAASIDTTLVTGVWTSGVSTSNGQGLGSTWTVSRISSDKSILANELWASGISVGSIITTSRLSSSVTVIANEVWSSGVSAKASIGSFSYTSSGRTGMAVEFWSSGFSALGSIVTSSYISSSRTVMGVEVWSSGVSAIGSTGSFSGLNVASTISCSGITVSSIATVSRLSSSVSVLAGAVWTSGLSVGNATAAGSLIVGISSTSSSIQTLSVTGSRQSNVAITWTEVQPGDVILATPMPTTAASDLSPGLTPVSNCTVAGRFQFALSNVSTLIANQSTHTWFFVRITPF